MPKVSKVKTPHSKPSEAKPARPLLDKYQCCRCGSISSKQKGKFPASHSSIYKGNNAYLPICNQCLDELYSHYKLALGDDKEAIRRVCSKFDIYWSPLIYDMLQKSSTSQSRIRAYISKTNLVMFMEKTFDDTIDEENAAMIQIVPMNISEEEATTSGLSMPVSSPVPIEMPSDDTVLFWGAGFTPEFYHELNMRYLKWTGSLPKQLDIAEEALYKQICISEATINRNIAAGKPVESSQKTLNDLLGALNAKPIQKKEDDASSDLESTPLGVWAKRWEEKRPIPDDEEMANKNVVVKYITTWFLGHLGKMLGVKNTYTKLYEDAINEYRVEKPEYEDEDDEFIFNDVFSSESEGGVEHDD